MRWIYQRTEAPVTIVRVKPTRGLPHHTLRAVFQRCPKYGKSAFTFHCDSLEVYFRQVPDANMLSEGKG